MKTTTKFDTRLKTYIIGVVLLELCAFHSWVSFLKTPNYYYPSNNEYFIVLWIEKILTFVLPAIISLVSVVLMKKVWMGPIAILVSFPFLFLYSSFIYKEVVQANVDTMDYWFFAPTVLFILISQLVISLIISAIAQKIFKEN